MDFGPCLTTTFEGGGLCGTTEKGLVVRLGERGSVAFDTELLRMSAAWDGWLRLRGTAYDGAHGPMPQRRGDVVAETAVGPGWAKDGEWSDPRPIPHGPLPRAWGRYDGYRLVGDDVVIDYRIGDMKVRESFALAGDDVPVLFRTLELGPSRSAQTMVVCDGPPGSGAGSASIGGEQRIALLQWLPRTTELVELLSTTGPWQRLSIGGPSSADYLDANSGTGATIAFVPGFARAHGAGSNIS
jgi:hypothetical protein